MVTIIHFCIHELAQRSLWSFSCTNPAPGCLPTFGNGGFYYEKVFFQQLSNFSRTHWLRQRDKKSEKTPKAKTLSILTLCSYFE